MSDEATKPAAAPAAAPGAMSELRQPALPQINVTPAVPTEFLAQLERAKLESAQRDAEAKKLAAVLEEQKALIAQLNEKAALSDKQRAELEGARRAEKIRYEARQAAMAHGAVDPDDVVALIAGALAVTDAGAVVTAGDNPQAVDAFVKAYLEKKPHLARARTAAGSGASPFPAPAGAAAAATAAQPARAYDLTTREGATASLRDAINLRLAAANGAKR